MRKEDKSTIIEQIAATVKEYNHFYLIDITAMNAAATSALRRECFKSDIKLMLIKNTLLHKALESLEEDYSPLYNCLKGTTAIMFCNTANLPAKLIKAKAKDGIPGLKAAYAEESFYIGADQLDALVSIKRMKLSPISLPCCNLRPRMLFLLFNQVVTPFTEFSRLLVNVPKRKFRKRVTDCEGRMTQNIIQLSN